MPWTQMEATNEQIDRNDLLASTRAIFVRAFVDGLESVIKQSAENLFAKAERASTSQGQKRMIEARGVLEKKSFDLKAQAKKAIEKLLHRSFQTTYSNYRPSFSNSIIDGPISLIDTSAFEDELRFNSITDRFRNEAGEQLRDLNIRIALLFEQDNIRERENPFRPYLFSRAIAMAVENVDAPPELHVVLTDQLAEDFASQVSSIYAAINKHLAENGIAAQLMLKPKRSAETRPAHDDNPDDEFQGDVPPVAHGGASGRQANRGQAGAANPHGSGAYHAAGHTSSGAQGGPRQGGGAARADSRQQPAAQVSPVERLFSSVRALATRPFRGGRTASQNQARGKLDVDTGFPQGGFEPSDFPQHGRHGHHGAPGPSETAQAAGSFDGAMPGASSEHGAQDGGSFAGAGQDGNVQRDSTPARGSVNTGHSRTGLAGGQSQASGGFADGAASGRGAGAAPGSYGAGAAGAAGAAHAGNNAPGSRGMAPAGSSQGGNAEGSGGLSGGGVAASDDGSGPNGVAGRPQSSNNTQDAGQYAGDAMADGQNDSDGGDDGGDGGDDGAEQQGTPDGSRPSWLSGKKAVGDVLRRFFAGGTASDDFDDFDETGEGETAPVRAAPGLLAGTVQRLIRHSTPSTSDMYSEGGELRNLIMERRSGLNEMASNLKEQMTIDIVSMLFEFILRDTQVPAEVRAQLGRLQFLVLKIALRDESLLTTKAHPARMLVNRIGSISLGLKQVDPSGIAVTEEICRIVEAILADETENPNLFLKMLDDLDTFIARELLTQEKGVATAVEVAEHAESRTLRLAHTCAQVSEALQGLNINEHLRDFLENDWARAIEYAERNNPAIATEYRALIPDLLWSVLPKVNEEDRQQLLALLPPILKTIHGGMEPIGWPAANKQTLMDWLFDAHTLVLRGNSATPPPITFSAIHAHFKKFVDNPEAVQITVLGKVTPMNRKGYLEEAMRELDARINMLDHFFDDDPELQFQLQEQENTEAEAATVAEVTQEQPDIAERLRVGVAIEVNLGGKPSTGRLNWINQNASNMVLTLTDQNEPSMISARMFQRLLKNDRVRFLESEPIFERAVESLLSAAEA